MLTVDDYGEIRRAHRDGMSIREIARRLRHSRRKVREAIREAEPRVYRRTRPREAPVLGPFKARIDAVLAEDEGAPRKQRHTAAKLYRRLREEEGYRGSYDQVRRYVASKRKAEKETLVPLAHDPGRRAECDFGHIYADFPEGRRRVPVLLTTWSYSTFRLGVALPSERVECVLDGMKRAFEFSRAVPWEVWWDNPKAVVGTVLKGRQRKMHERYAALASHYRFDPVFCMPGSPEEKPYVENSVYDLQRDWATPVPQVQDYEVLNAHLRRCALALRDHRVRGQSETIGERFEREKAAALRLPPHPFDPYVPQPAKVDKYQTVRCDSHLYSVPRRWAFETVTVKLYPWRVEVIAQGATVASHARSYAQEERMVLDPHHYVDILQRRPAALDHAGVFRSWRLPGCFDDLREKLEQRYGPAKGTRLYIRVLQLLGEHPLKRVQQAIQLYASSRPADADMVIMQVRRLALKEQLDRTDQDQPPSVMERLAQIKVAAPDLAQFDQLMPSPQGGSADVTDRTSAFEVELETTAPANDPGRS